MQKKKALISVTDKTDVLSFAEELKKLDYQIISTGGTYNLLKEHNIQVTPIEEYTGSKEVFDGRVKTLHPKVHGGILYERDKESHHETAELENIDDIDLVCVNLYEFEKTLRSGKDEKSMIESIDIGGPTLIRGAAKNFYHVMVVTDPKDYGYVIDTLKKKENTKVFRKSLAAKAFAAIAEYDDLIAYYFTKEENYPTRMALPLRLKTKLRYGENPHQEGYLYETAYKDESILDYEQLQGKEISFNNINDLFGALALLAEFNEDKVTCVAVKHGAPCGVAIGKTSLESFEKTMACDPISIFGGIIVFNDIVDGNTAKELNSIFLEVIGAPGYTDEALAIFKKKKNVRVFKMMYTSVRSNKDMKYLDGYWLSQDRDNVLYDNLENVTNTKASEKDLEDMIFAMKIVKHLKSNAIAIVKDKQTLALCGGQTARIFSLQDSLYNNKEKDFQGAIMASDGFFPFDDCVTLAHEKGISGIIQPGGSIQDQQSIEACNKFGLSMVLTKIRHFKH